MEGIKNATLDKQVDFFQENNKKKLNKINE